jgi:hypothetical protein
MHITNKTETEDTIFEFTLSHSGSPENSFNQTLVHRFLIDDIISYNNPTRNLFFFF